MQRALNDYRVAKNWRNDATILSVAPAPGRPLGFLCYAPKEIASESTILVCVHGLNRNAASQFFRFRPLADETGSLLVAPIFSRQYFRHYQTLDASKDGFLPDQELAKLLSEISSLFGVEASKYNFFGYSGGAQFVHRFAMRFPDVVSHIILAAAGWYTFPDILRPYPYGVAKSGIGTNCAFETFLQLPMDVLVGDEDCHRDNTLNKASQIDDQQGKTRVDRARNYVRCFRKEALRRAIEPRITLQLIKGGTHSFEQNVGRCGLIELVGRRFFPRPDAHESVIQSRASVSVCA